MQAKSVAPKRRSREGGLQPASSSCSLLTLTFRLLQTSLLNAGEVCRAEAAQPRRRTTASELIVLATHAHVPPPPDFAHECRRSLSRGSGAAAKADYSQRAHRARCSR